MAIREQDTLFHIARYQMHAGGRGVGWLGSDPPPPSPGLGRTPTQRPFLHFPPSRELACRLQGTFSVHYLQIEIFPEPASWSKEETNKSKTNSGSITDHGDTYTGGRSGIHSIYNVNNNNNNSNNTNDNTN